MKITKSTIYATGRRKEAVARIWLNEGESGISINGKKMEDYVDRENLKMIIRQPLEATRSVGRFGIVATVKGGGKSGQASAVKHGIARALVKYDESLRPTLRKGGFLTRDPREKERKKYGQKGARKRFQFTKR